MSPPAPQPPAPSPPADRRFAKDVAKHLDRRRVRRRLLGWAIVLGALALGALYLTCGRGWGLGRGAGQGAGSGPGSGPGPGSVNALLTTIDAGPSRCHVRVAAAGISAEGKPATVDEALAVCRAAAAAEVLVTGGARAGDWKELKAAFDRAGIQILKLEPRGASGSAADDARGPGGDSPAGAGSGGHSSDGSVRPPGTGSGSPTGASGGGG